MDNYTILNCMKKTIQDSLEWGIGEKEYGYFVDGVVAMTEKLEYELERIYKERIKAFKETSTIIGTDKEDA